MLNSNSITSVLHVSSVSVLISGGGGFLMGGFASSPFADSNPFLFHSRCPNFSLQDPPINGLCNSRLCRPRLRPLRLRPSCLGARRACALCVSQQQHPPKMGSQRTGCSISHRFSSPAFPEIWLFVSPVSRFTVNKSAQRIVLRHAEDSLPDALREEGSSSAA